MISLKEIWYLSSKKWLAVEITRVDHAKFMSKDFEKQIISYKRKQQLQNVPKLLFVVWKVHLMAQYLWLIIFYLLIWKNVSSPCVYF